MIVFNPSKVTYKFTKKISGVSSEAYKESPKKIQVTLNDESDLEELLESFQDFLIACGFFLEENEKVAIIKEIEKDEEIEDESDSDI